MAHERFPSRGFPSPPAVSGNDVTEFSVRDANPHFARWHDGKIYIITKGDSSARRAKPNTFEIKYRLFGNPTF